MLNLEAKPETDLGYFSHVVDESIDSIISFQEREDTKSMWQRESGSIQFQARFFDSLFGELRSVHIFGPKIQIINMFFFPHYEKELPVYAMEMVLYGKKPIVAVMDLIGMPCTPKASEDAHRVLMKAHEKYPNLHNADDPPNWFTECRSGNDFFIRPKSTEEITNLLSVHNDIWKSLLSLLQGCSLTNKNDLFPFSREVQNYKDHHRENSPGLKFLNRSFGEEWTNAFLKQHLFR